MSSISAVASVEIGPSRQVGLVSHKELHAMIEETTSCRFVAMLTQLILDFAGGPSFQGSPKMSLLDRGGPIQGLIELGEEAIGVLIVRGFLVVYDFSERQRFLIGNIPTARKSHCLYLAHSNQLLCMALKTGMHKVYELDRSQSDGVPVLSSLGGGVTSAMYTQDGRGVFGRADGTVVVVKNLKDSRILKSIKLFNKQRVQSIQSTGRDQAVVASYKEIKVVDLNQGHALRIVGPMAPMIRMSCVQVWAKYVVYALMHGANKERDRSIEWVDLENGPVTAPKHQETQAVISCFKVLQDGYCVYATSEGFQGFELEHPQNECAFPSVENPQGEVTCLEQLSSGEVVAACAVKTDLDDPHWLGARRDYVTVWV